VHGTVEFVTYLGSTASYRVVISGGHRLQVTEPLAAERAPFAEGDTVALWWAPDRGLILV